MAAIGFNIISISGEVAVINLTKMRRLHILRLVEMILMQRNSGRSPSKIIAGAIHCILNIVDLYGGRYVEISENVRFCICRCQFLFYGINGKCIYMDSTNWSRPGILVISNVLIRWNKTCCFSFLCLYIYLKRFRYHMDPAHWHWRH